MYIHMYIPIYMCIIVIRAHTYIYIYITSYKLITYTTL